VASLGTVNRVDAARRHTCGSVREPECTVSTECGANADEWREWATRNSPAWARFGGHSTQRGRGEHAALRCRSGVADACAPEANQVHSPIAATRLAIRASERFSAASRRVPSSEALRGAVVGPRAGERRCVSLRSGVRLDPLLRLIIAVRIRPTDTRR
jgi:hypothetical protein